MRRYRIAREARDDLDNIWEYIAPRGGIETATRFIGRIHEAFRLLATSPGIGTQRENLGTGLRSFPVGNYLIYYRAMRGGRIVVARVLHGMRRQEKAYESS